MVLQKNISTVLLFGILTLFCTNKLLAQSDDSIPVPNQRQLLLSSQILHEERVIWVHLPENYALSTATYPVLYLLDGDSHFSYVAEMITYLSGSEKMRVPQMIVVAILNKDRQKDFTPIHSLIFNGKVDNRLATSGGGENFLRFIKDELVPYIDKNYRTQNYRVLEGHSLGGLFAVYAREAAPDLFQSNIIISPAFYGGNLKVLGDVTGFLRAHPHLSGKMFISIGDENTEKVDSLVYQIKTFAPASFHWSFKKYEEEDHLSVPYKSMYDGIRFIYSNWHINIDDSTKIASYKDIQAHFNKLSDEFGYKIHPTEDVVNRCGYQLLRTGHIDTAIDIFKQNIKNYPNAYNVYDSMGEAYMTKGDKARAIENYEKSIAINPHNEAGKEMLLKLKSGK
jgi:predicted alpha/beta superfamily hydrolase